MSYVENRVYVKDFATLPVDSNLLVPIATAPGHKQQYIHKAILPDFLGMAAACEADLGIPFLIASGHRPPLWDTREAYEADMIKQYGSVEEGQKWRAFASAHQTGLALDAGSGGLMPDSKTIPEQKKTKIYAWIVANAYKWKFAPYLREPWHVEHKVSINSFKAGVPDTEESSPVYQNPIMTCDEANDVCIEAPLDWVTVK
jgi:hypothetical protein